MKSIEALLEPFVGYLDLGMFVEADEELENLPVEVKNLPAVLHARLALLVEMAQWKKGVTLGRKAIKLHPEEFEFYFKTAYCLHELKQTDKAKATLAGAPEEIREEALYCYNLACYETQLGHLEEAKQLLKACFKKDPRFREESQDDPDLEPLRGYLSKI